MTNQIRELKQTLELKDKYKNKDHNRKVDITKLRFNLSVKLLDLRNQVSEKRHNERIQILETKV